jgi:hypothetical protein
LGRQRKITSVFLCVITPIYTSTLYHLKANVAGMVLPTEKFMI